MHHALGTIRVYARDQTNMQEDFMSNNVGDWMKMRCGDRVHEIEGRHFGRVEAIHNSSIVTVRWERSGWLSQHHLSELVNLSRYVRRYRHEGPF